MAPTARQNRPTNVPRNVDIIVVAGGGPADPGGHECDQDDSDRHGGDRTDPVEAGLVDSLARPGGNTTGVTNLGAELGGKRLELLKEAGGKVSHVAVLYDLDIPGHAREVKEDFPVAARALRLTVQHWEVRGADGIERVFVEKRRSVRMESICLGGAVSVITNKQLAGFALKSRLPSMFFTRAAVDDGGLMSYGADVADSYRQVAWYVDRILKGTKPDDLPVEQPTKFELVVNLQTANQIGVTIPPNVLARATIIIR